MEDVSDNMDMDLIYTGPGGHVPDISSFGPHHSGEIRGSLLLYPIQSHAKAYD